MTASSQDVLIAAGVCVRMVAAVCTGTLPIVEGVSLRIRLALAAALAVVAVPIATKMPPLQPDTGTAIVLAGEAFVGLAFGTAIAASLAATAWAGGVLGTASGLSWADDFAPAGDQQAAGVSRLAWWVGLAAFVAAGGQLAVVSGLVDTVRHVPVGAVGTASVRDALVGLAVDLPAQAVALAASLAMPALSAVLAFHLAAAICVRTVSFVPGTGLLQGLAAVVLLVSLWLGLESWIHGGSAAVLAAVADCFRAR